MFVSPLILESFDSNKFNTSNTTQITNTSKISNGDTVVDIKIVTSSAIPFYSNQILLAGYTVTMLTFALILLSPIIKGAKLGATSIELSIIDTATNKKTELEFIDK